MVPPYEITTSILSLVSSISERIGAINATFLVKANPVLRKQNIIKTIHASLGIEGNTLTERQITAIIENKRVLGPSKDIQEVENAIALYDAIHSLNPGSEKSFLQAHGMLMKGLVNKPGCYRSGGVGIVKGSQVQHLAPPAANVPGLMKDLFKYSKTKKELSLLKSCVFHYEMEFIHPFEDGNGRMGRLWQTLILMQEYPVFQFLPFETLIAASQQEYYKVLSICDKAGTSTVFIEYMLKVIDTALSQLLLSSHATHFNQQQRLAHFMEVAQKEFTRKDYLNVFKMISEATASRDLKFGVEHGYFTKMGDKRNTTYCI